ncbi:MAG: SDR family NAD(P)-dependent oxidoreductase [Nocardioidaceae bacterium]
MTRTDGPVAIVTGGAQGIGEAVVRRLHRGGATVASLDIDGDRATASATAIDPDRPPLALACDIRDAQQVEQATSTVLELHGRVDVLVNNAGVAAYFDAVTMTEDDWDDVFAVDLKATWLCARAVLPGMRAQGSGAIVNVSSIHSRMTLAGAFPYAAAKAGVLGLTRSLALDNGPYGIRVNAVCPGYTRTVVVQQWLDMQPNPGETAAAVDEVHALGRIGEPDEIAATIAFLASDDASFVTGAELLVDGGLSARFAS